MWNLEVCNLEVNTALTGHRSIVMCEISVLCGRPVVLTVTQEIVFEINHVGYETVV